MANNPGGIAPKTLIGVLSSHDDNGNKDDELAVLFNDQPRLQALSNFHFVFTGGTYDRVTTKLNIQSQTAAAFLRENTTKLPPAANGGVIMLANLVVQQQCSILWSFLSPSTMHWLNPENLALLRLCDLWNVKRLVNKRSVEDWCKEECDRDVKRHRQEMNPFKMRLGTSGKDYECPFSEVPAPGKVRELEWSREKGDSFTKAELRDKDFWDKSIALVAHDAMKEKMADFAVEYEEELRRFGRILTTGTTGQVIEGACRHLRNDAKVRKCLSGPKGGDIEIATEIFLGRCEYVVFFIDPLNPHPHIDDIRAVFSACMAPVSTDHVRILTNEVQAREWIEEAVRRKR